MSRFRFFALFATVAALMAVFAACGGGDDEGGSSSGEDPQELVDNASLKGVKSGELDVSMHVTSKGEDAGEVDVNLSGPFEQGAKGELPQLEMTLEASGSGSAEELDFAGGITLLTDRGFIDFEGTNYEVDPTTFGFVKAALEQSQQQGGKEDITACQEAAEGIEFSQFGEDLQSEGGADVGGTETTRVSGDFNVSGFIDAMLKLAESPACASQLEAAGTLPEESEVEEARSEVEDAIKKSHVELYVGEDEIIRKAIVEMTIAPQKADGEVEMEMEATLTEVNEEQSFSTPSDAKPIQALFKKIGIDPLQLLEAGGSEGLGALLEGLTEGAVPGGSSSGGGAGSDAYTECLQEAQTPADIQKCASLR